MSDYKKQQPQQTNKPDVEPITKARTSTLSSLSNLPPLIGINHPMKQSAGSLPGISQSKDMHQIKAMIDIGLGMYAHKGSYYLTFRKHYRFMGLDFQWHSLYISFCNGLQCSYISSTRWN
jgi:hypothetical protein